MRLTLDYSALESVAADWLIVTFWEKASLSSNAARLDELLGGLLTKLYEQGDITGKAKELTPIYQCPNLKAKRVLLVGLGSRDKAD